MINLHWVFTNKHAWELSFNTVSEAEKHFYKCDMLKNCNIDRAWIQTDSETVWLKEKHVK